MKADAHEMPLPSLFLPSGEEEARLLSLNVGDLISAGTGVSSWGKEKEVDAPKWGGGKKDGC